MAKRIIVYRLTDANRIRIDSHAKIAYMCSEDGTVMGDLFAHFRFFHPNDEPQVSNVKIVKGKRDDNLKVTL